MFSRWNNFEIISKFRQPFQAWLHVKQNTEIILKSFQCFILHVTTVSGYM